MAAVPAPSSAGDQGPGVPSPVGKRASGRRAHISSQVSGTSTAIKIANQTGRVVHHCAVLGGSGMIPAG